MHDLDVEVTPIDASAIGGAATFLHRNLNSRVSVHAWRALLDPPWTDRGPNAGFVLMSGGRIVGVYAAVYSSREVENEIVTVCNLAAFCVEEDYRPHALRLIRSLLGQKGLVFTDLSPSGNVVSMNERLGLRRLDTTTRLVANLPHVPRRHTRVTSSARAIGELLTGRDAVVFQDHLDAPAAQHLVVTRGASYAYLMFRSDRRRKIPVFASPIYVGGSRSLLEAEWAAVRSHLLFRHGLLATLAERRVLGFAKGFGEELANPRPKMYRGAIDPEQVDYLYSELTLVRW